MPASAGMTANVAFAGMTISQNRSRQYRGKAIRLTHQNKKAAEAAFAILKIEITPISESAPDISAAIPLWTPDGSYRG
jgi:hypothetical protein